jgi:uncharacterized repeat protein (TIGR03803 family)
MPHTRKMFWILLALIIATATASPAQTFTTLAIFDGTNGEEPVGSLVQGLNGNFYGTTYVGGVNSSDCDGDGCGTVFEITPAGKLTTLYSFCSQPNCADGEYPAGGLILATNGNFYGTTGSGGANGGGTFFRITSGGKLTTLYSFCSQASCSDGKGPGALVQGVNGNFYGTTFSSGVNGDGTVFEITPAGKLTTLYSFCSQAKCADGYTSRGALVQGTNGSFYGTTFSGGANGDGTVFEITPAGELTTLYSFCSQADCTDGLYADWGLVQAINGNFYGTTYSGGAYNAGTVFEITPAGKLTTFFNFECCTEGILPSAGVVQATNGSFYGTANDDGVNCATCGTIFEITEAGQLATLYNFCSQGSYPDCADGFQPRLAGLLQATSGKFYGTTPVGGDAACNDGYGCGTVFTLSVGLGRFVETVPTAGKVGSKVFILGNNLTGATSVTFNGTAAVFTVVSDSEITTTVPTGANTSFVNVTTPSRSLKSNKKFRVTP